MLNSNSRYLHVAMNLTRLGPAAATIGNTCMNGFQDNLLNRVSQLHWSFSLPERLKADNMDLTSHLPRSLFDVGSGRISIVTVNT
ncbi:hypothetical protein Tco_0276891 [Tanacetum coccineum]